MKIRHNLLLSLSSACLIVMGSQMGSAQMPHTQSNSMTAGSNAIAGLVPATVELNNTLDARKEQAGAAFETTLKSTVHLKDGTKLPKGTLLEGKVAATEEKTSGSSQLALVFTDAKLKSGKDVPIQATIVGLADPIEGTDSNSSNDGPISWDGTTTQFDVSGAIGNVELHSKIGGENSGMLIASGKSDFRLIPRSRMSLALGDKSAN